jgi:hypothetical protein
MATNIDPQLLAEYDGLTVKQAKLEAELEAIKLRRDQLRAVLLGGSTVRTPKKNDERPLSALQRLTRQPPKALKGVIEIARELGRVTNQQVAEKLNIPIETASLRLSRATREGFLTRVAQGVYEVDDMP